MSMDSSQEVRGTAFVSLLTSSAEKSSFSTSSLCFVARSYCNIRIYQSPKVLVLPNHDRESSKTSVWLWVIFTWEMRTVWLWMIRYIQKKQWPILKSIKSQNRLNYYPQSTQKTVEESISHLILCIIRKINKASNNLFAWTNTSYLHYLNCICNGSIY